MDAYTRDVGYLTSDLLTGKSLPVLTAIAMVPLDPSLLGTMVLLGVFGGTVVTLTHAWAPPPPGSLAWGARFANLFFAAFLDVSFCMHVAERTGASPYWAIPAFAVAMQALPERPSTPVVLGTLTLALFYLSVFETASHTVHHPSVAGARRLLAARPSEGGLHEDAHRVLDSLGGSLLVLALTFYASICHGPLVSQRYTSAGFAKGRWYSAWVCTAAGLTRAYTYLATAFFQDHALHGLLDGSGRPPEPWTAWLYQAALVYSAAWACTQFTEQVSCVHCARGNRRADWRDAGAHGAAGGPHGPSGARAGAGVHSGLLARVGRPPHVLGHHRGGRGHARGAGGGLGARGPASARGLASLCLRSIKAPGGDLSRHRECATPPAS